MHSYQSNQDLTTIHSDNVRVDVSSHSMSSQSQSSCSEEVPSALMQSARYQQLLVWRERIQEASQLIWMSPENKMNWVHSGLDPQQLSKEWYTFTLQWVLTLLKKSSKKFSSAAVADQHFLKSFQRYVRQFQKINSALQKVRQADFDAALAKYQYLLVGGDSAEESSSKEEALPSSSSQSPSVSCKNISWCEEFSKLATKNVKEDDTESLLFHILCQRPDVVVSARRPVATPSA